MRGALISALCALVIASTIASPIATAQQPRLTIDLPRMPDPPAASTSGTVAAAGASTAGDSARIVRQRVVGPAVRAMDVLNDGQTRDLLRNGFPARLHFRLELWHANGLFNALDATREWDVIVRYDPVQKRYRAARLLGDSVSVLGDFDSYPALASAVAAPDTIALMPGRRPGRFYYNAVLDVEMLSANDLDEVERWLRGELGPSLRGRRNPGGVIGRGLRTLFVRLLGAERRHYDARSKTMTMR